MQFIAPAAGVGNIFTARALAATKLLQCKANATEKMDKHAHMIFCNLENRANCGICVASFVALEQKSLKYTIFI